MGHHDHWRDDNTVTLSHTDTGSRKDGNHTDHFDNSPSHIPHTDFVPCIGDLHRDHHDHHGGGNDYHGSSIDTYIGPYNGYPEAHKHCDTSRTYTEDYGVYADGKYAELNDWYDWRDWHEWEDHDKHSKHSKHSKHH